LKGKEFLKKKAAQIRTDLLRMIYEAKESLVNYKGPVYSRIGRSPVPDIYESTKYCFKIGKAVTLKDGLDITIISTGETAKTAIDSASVLQKVGITCRVLNTHTTGAVEKTVDILVARSSILLTTDYFAQIIPALRKNLPL
jgi:transketolase C-terminal domain/subunit